MRDVTVEPPPLLKRLFEKISGSIDPAVSEVLGRALEGKEVSKKDAVELFKAGGAELAALMLVADEMRRRTVGQAVTFVVNRNINFTNVCFARCRFCAFSTEEKSSEAYLLTVDQVAARAEQAWKTGATEVCIQGGLHPGIEEDYYENICRAIKGRAPLIHIHAFSPMEVFYGAWKAGLTVKEYLKVLKEAGLDSMPGTAAEILDDEVRDALCPAKIGVRDWVEVVKEAHRQGIPTTSTIMYGHIEQPQHWADHLELIRTIQKETKGFTEFIPLSFVYPNTPLYRIDGARPGATGAEDLKMHAVSRLMLNGWIRNIQASWVKLGPRLAQICLLAGANDLGGTLMEENISRAAGVSSGQKMDLGEMVRIIRGIGRTPAQRNTTYKILKVHE
ncbi:5-amino-6-(D-ribitylamino)uracil--L-tyrosine 4-hydroxyphenyl transferase CofH [Candidatus Bathyarchaeota archaeon]|nr:5-amino-6-(D-ribitylamino)uracil--L-tyrosine 4-hydroxyphenyl transferase CofH [Candidatus Bathyarchaeota archaeon]